jgi:hypothetical protein
VYGLQFDYEEKDKSIKILEKDFIKSRLKFRLCFKKTSKPKATMGNKISELEASISEKNK